MYASITKTGLKTRYKQEGEVMFNLIQKHTIRVLATATVTTVATVVYNKTTINISVNGGGRD